MAPVGQGEGRGALPTCRGGAGNANVLPALMEVGTRNFHGIVAKQKIVWKHLKAKFELDEIEKRAPTACRLKHCDWPNVERTERH